MSILDFPSSPTNGQSYNGYVYDSSVGAWKRETVSKSFFFVGETKPTNPGQGDIWFDATSGQVYMHYIDEDGGQWVHLGVGKQGNQESEGALDFPSTPSNNQQYGDYTYISAKGVWQSSATLVDALEDLSNVDSSEAQEGDIISYSESLNSWIKDSYKFNPIKRSKNIIEENYSLDPGFNSASIGPITISQGFSVTIGDGESWVIL